MGTGRGHAGSVALGEAPLPHPGGLDYCLVVGFARHHLFTDLVPLQELGIHVAVGVVLAGVNQVGDEQILLLVGQGTAPSRGLFSRLKMHLNERGIQPAVEHFNGFRSTTFDPLNL